MSSIDNLAQKIKSVHPEYQDMDSLELVQKILKKFPQYSDMLDPGDRTLLGNISSMDNKGPVDDLMGISKDIGNMVKGGGAGIADIDAALLPRAANMIPGVNMETPSLTGAVQQAGQDVTNVENSQPAETTAGKIGSTVGSFFTPNQIALQALGGAAAEPIANAVGNVAAPVAKGLVNAFPKISRMIGAAPEAISTLADNPEAVNAAKSLPQTAQDVASAVQGLGQKGMEAAKAGAELLSDSTPVPGIKDQLMRMAAKMANDPLAEEGDKAAADYVSQVAKSVKNNATESDIGDLISSLDEKINTKWSKANPGPATAAKEEIRRLLSRALQGQNPAYAKAMAESSATFEPTETLTKSLGLGQGAPGDTTVNALRKINDPEALATQRALTSLPGLAGPVANAAAKDALQQTLLGKSALFLAPYLNPTLRGGVQALPAAGNAAAQAVQGLTQ